MTNLNPFKARILTVLIKHRTFMTTAKIAKKAGDMSWNTAEKYLKEMLEDNWVKCVGKATKHWKAIVDETYLD